MAFALAQVTPLFYLAAFGAGVVLLRREAWARTFGPRSRFLLMLPAAGAIGSGLQHWTPLADQLATWKAYDAYVGLLLLAGTALLARSFAAMQQVHRELATSENLFRAIFETTGTAIMVVGEEDRIELVNHEFERLSGFARQEVEGARRWTDFFGGELLTQLIEDHKLRRQYRYAVPRHYEAFFSDKLQHRREVFITIGMIRGTQRCVIALLDLTEHKQTLLALRGAEMRYRGIFENAIEGIFQTTPNGKYLHANPTLARMYGYSSAEELMSSLTDIGRQLYVDPARRAEFVAELQASGEVRNFESQIYRKQGDVIWISENARAVGNERGEVCYYEGMVADITEQKMNELALQAQYQLLQKTIDELETAQSTLVEQERLRALGQMASGIAHDFNNTLSPILGFSELLLKRPDNLNDPAKVKRYLEMIHTAAKDASNVVRCLREFYRLRNDQELGASMDLNKLVAETIQLTQPRWKNQAQASGINIQVVTDLNELPPVPGVESNLREALMNLIFNAIDAMQQGGTLTLSTWRTVDAAVIEVRDTGTGMDAVTRKRCFEPFFTTKGARGTGLGLAMVYGVINRHGGSIEVESEPGRGTAIQLRLPARVPLTPRSEGTGIIEPDSERALHILFLEDDDTVRLVIREYLSDSATLVTALGNGREGVECFEPGKFDLLLTDKSMPGMNGDAVARELKRLDPNLPVIMLTGFGDMMEAVGEMPPGVDSILSKPVMLDDLRTEIRKVLELYPARVSH